MAKISAKLINKKLFVRPPCHGFFEAFAIAYKPEKIPALPEVFAQGLKIPQRILHCKVQDAARAGLLFGFAHKWPLVQSGRLGAILGSLVCEQEGTLLDALDLDLMQAKAKETYGEALPRLQ